MDIDKFKNLKISNAILTIMCEFNIKNYQIIKELIKNNNTIMVITNKKFNYHYNLQKKLFQINLNYKNDIELVVSKGLVAQLLSFSLAKYLNDKALIFKRLSSMDLNFQNKDKFLNKIKNFESVFLNISWSNKLKLYILQNNQKMIKKISLEIFNSLSRTIDTVRHQAKTITVGTNRSNSFQKKFLNKHKIIHQNKFVIKKYNQKNFIYNFNSIFDKSSNFKILHDTSNFKNALVLSEFFAVTKNTAFAIDTIENHKHVDISSEPLIIALLNSNNKDDFIIDSISEFESMISHNNKIFLITDLIDTRYLKVFNKDSIYCTYNKLFDIQLFQKIFK